MWGKLIAEQVQGAMRILGQDEDGLAQRQTYVVVDDSPAAYNVDTGRMEAARNVSHPDIPMAIVRFQIDEMDSEVQPTVDRKVLIAGLDLPGIQPKAADVIELANGMVYEVRRMLSLPGDAMHILHVRFNQAALA